MFVFAGLILGLVFLSMGADINFALLPFIVGMVIQAVPRQVTVGKLPKNARRADPEKWLRTEGYLPQTTVERRQSIVEEKEVYNKNSREFAASLEGGQQDFYYDFDGCPRDVATNEYL